jgi:hypothetical protein
MPRPIAKSRTKELHFPGGSIRFPLGADLATARMAKAIAKGMKARKEEEKAKAAAKATLPPPDLRPKPHLVAFVDILGFGRELESAKTEEDLKRIYAKVRKVQEEFQFAEACDEPKEQSENNADYGRRVIALSDSIVVAITPKCAMQPLMGGYDLLGFALFELIVAQARCALHGVFVRGGLSHGPFFFENDVLISPAQARAYDLETNYAEYPLIVVPESTRLAVLKVPKMGSCAPEADPTPRYFIKYGRRQWKGEQLYYLDYMGVMLEEDHRGWSPEDRKEYLAARKSGDDHLAQELLNRRAKKDAAYFLHWHRRRLEEAYAATSSEKVRKKYRWLMKYHNRSFRNDVEYLRDEVIDLSKFQPAANKLQP